MSLGKEIVARSAGQVWAMRKQVRGFDPVDGREATAMQAGVLTRPITMLVFREAVRSRDAGTSVSRRSLFSEIQRAGSRRHQVSPSLGGTAGAFSVEAEAHSRFLSGGDLRSHEQG